MTLSVFSVQEMQTSNLAFKLDINYCSKDWGQ